MVFLAVDDERPALYDLTSALQEVAPGSQILTASSGRKALELVKSYQIDVAFLDIEIGGTNGIDLARKIREMQPDVRIIFVTSHDSYALDAFSVHATGYLLKPVFSEDLARELTFAYPEKPQKRIRIQTFGGFDIFVDGKPLSFRRSKAKELLALLVDRRGGTLTSREACAYLFEDASYDESQSAYFRMIVAELSRTLEAANARDILLRERNQLSIDPTQFDCDAYDFLAGDPVAINSYRGDYMSCYSWAEYSVGMFEDY
ncbi:MAG TPA: histidine kinase [Lachnospiraceae bacterium]|nr:histidine kinase [Lachnospiraceae bacterium]